MRATPKQAPGTKKANVAVRSRSPARPALSLHGISQAGCLHSANPVRAETERKLEVILPPGRTLRTASLMLLGLLVLLLSSTWGLASAVAQMPAGTATYSADAKWICDTARSAETCSSSHAAHLASCTPVDVTVTHSPGLKVGATVGTGAAPPICASGCTIAAAPSNAHLSPAYEVANETTRVQNLRSRFFRAKVRGLSRKAGRQMGRRASRRQFEIGDSRLAPRIRSRTTHP